MRRRSIVVALALSVALASGWLACGGDDSGRAPTAPPQPAPTPSPPSDPPELPDPQDPPSSLDTDLRAGNIDAGNVHYQQYCASCHGPTGAGDGPIGAALDPKPADHSDGNYMNGLSDEHLFKVVKFGGTAVDRSPLMAPWGGTLGDAEIVDVIAFVRSLADPPYAAAP